MKCAKCGMETTCRTCNGLGYFICKTCNGLGRVKKLQFNQNPIKPMQKCTACNGKGFYKDLFSNDPFSKGKIITCSVCKGTGFLEKIDLSPKLPEFEKCYACNGTGKTICFTCNGKGSVKCLCE